MANSARERSTCAAGALSERLRRVSSWRSSAASGRKGSFRWRDMGHLGARGSPHHHTTSHGNRPTSDEAVLRNTNAAHTKAHPLAVEDDPATEERTDDDHPIEVQCIHRRVAVWRGPYVLRLRA